MKPIKFKQEVEGFYQLHAVGFNEDGTEAYRRELTPIFPNLITDIGLDRMGDHSDWLAYCQVGTGTTAPANTDTTLTAFLAATNTQQSISFSVAGSAPYYAQTQKTYRFGVGVATGNIGEVGIAWTNGSSSLYSHALILDGGGIPTTITVLSTEALDVTYIIRVYPPTVDVTGTISISSASYDYTIRAANVTNSTQPTSNGAGWGFGPGGSAGYRGLTSNSNHTVGYTGTLGAVTGVPSGSTANGLVSNCSAVNDPYIPGSLSRSATVTWQLNGGNLSPGMRSMVFTFSWCCYQIQIDPYIPKTSSDILSLQFQHSWARKTLP
jgi:hypothetical protein